MAWYRLWYRQERLSQEKPIIEGFLAWLDKQDPVRNSRLDKAVTYIRNRKEHLATYLEDGRCSFSNNISENAIRPFVCWPERMAFLRYTGRSPDKCHGIHNGRNDKGKQSRSLPLSYFPVWASAKWELIRWGTRTACAWNENVKIEIECRISCQNEKWSLNCIWIVNVLQLLKTTGVFFDNGQILSAYIWSCGRCWEKLRINEIGEISMLKLAKTFSNGLIMQQGKEVAVWGEASC